MTVKLHFQNAVWLVAVVLVTGCAATLGLAGARAPRVCPDGAPVRMLQDPACGRDCGFSCLPDRWKAAPR